MSLKKKYLDLAWNFLEQYIGLSYERWIHLYEVEKEACVLEEIDGLFYLLFCVPVVDHHLERGILLVFDGDTIIADLAFLHGSMNDVMKEKEVYDFITLESDWSNLQYYTLCAYYFAELPYPYYKSGADASFDGQALFFSNAYVTKVYRKKHIFFSMLDMAKEMALRFCEGSVYLYSIFSLDPDIPCYGPDTTDEPYYYSMKDEPTRLWNGKILEKKGYTAVRLEDEEENDGSKLWYALLKEKDEILEIAGTD